MQFSEKELSVLEDTDFLLTKANVLDKIYNLLGTTRAELIKGVKESDFTFPEGTDLQTGKISRGENYLCLPYMVLDYPALFTSENTFAYRTMFWWGNFFSATLQLEGKSLNKYRNTFVAKIDKLTNNNIYIGIGETPWRYHYGNDNYTLITESHKKHITHCRFLKLSKKSDLKEYKGVPEFSKNFLEFILSLLKEPG